MQSSIIKSSSKAILRFPPGFYRPEIFVSQIEIFRKEKVAQTLVDLNQHVDLLKWKIEDFSDGNRKKNRQFKEKHGEFSLLSPSEFSEAYEILRESRIRIGAKLSIEKERLENEIKKQNGIYKMFGTKINNKIASVAITVQIDEVTEYVLYWGDTLEYRSLSPVVSLFIGLREYFLDHSINILDLGVSSVKGVTNIGLSRFKKNLGAIESERITLEILI